MKKNGITALATCTVILLLWAGGCATAPDTPRTEKTPEVEYARGDTGPAGGIVFYVDRRGEYEWTYLEAAPAGWFDGGEDPLFAWGELGIEVGASESAIGTGAANTNVIANEPGDYAAKVVAERTINGYDDWFLPSLGEIGEMYENLFRRQIGGLSRDAYWTSTERTPDRAMSRNFETAGQISAQKMHENRVRPIRSF